MSTLSGSQTLGVGVYSYTQQLTDGTSSTSSASTGDSASASAVSTAEQAASSGQTTGAHHGHHHHGGGASGLQGQIQQAVTSALGDADDDSDPNDVIQNAIEQVLQNPASNAADPNDPANPASSASQSPTAAGGTPDQPGSATFEQFLQSQGVNMDQFKSDLASAFQQAQGTGGEADLSTAFSQLPPGTVVDASA